MKKEQNQHTKQQCVHGSSCRNTSSHHMSSFIHPSSGSTPPKHNVDGVSPKTFVKSPKKIVFLQDKEPCEEWDQCKDISDSHRDSHFHPCRHGQACEKLNNELHKNRYMHACPYGLECKLLDLDEGHMLYWYHHYDTLTQSKLGNPTSTDGSKVICPYIHLSKCPDKTGSHMKKYYHLCENNLTCTLKGDPNHTSNMLHSCHNGLKCHSLKNREHYTKFTHHISTRSFSPSPKIDDIDLSKLKNVCIPSKSTGSSSQSNVSSLSICSFGKKCNLIRDKFHTSNHIHPCPDSICKKFDDKAHLAMNYLHICKNGSKCTSKDINHRMLFIHPCRDGSKCMKLADVLHIIRYSHPTSSSSDLGVSIPSHWIDPKPPSIISNLTHYKLVKLKNTCKEYLDVKKNFEKTIKKKLTSLTIISIERNENYNLLAQYSTLYSHIKTKNNGNVNEKQLFHGAAVNDIICISKQGFDIRVSDKNSHYGIGIYFALNSSYSEGYAKADSSGERKMILARVIIGDTEKLTGKSTQRKPNTNPATGKPYDSCCSPTGFEWTVFVNHQAYPEYIITFK